MRKFLSIVLFLFFSLNCFGEVCCNEFSSQKIELQEQFKEIEQFFSSLDEDLYFVSQKGFNFLSAIGTVFSFCQKVVFANDVYNFLNDFFDLFHRDKSFINSSNREFKYLRKFEKTKSREERNLLIKDILNSEDWQNVSVFMEEIFVVLADYFASNIQGFIENIKDAFTSIFESNKAQEQLVFKGKKKKQKASAIFGAIANLCTQVAVVATSQEEEEKQQAALGAIGTVFNLASQITAIDAVHDQKNINLEKREKMREKASWIKDNFLSNPLVKKILSEIFDYLKYYLEEKTDHFLDYLKEKIMILLFNEKEAAETVGLVGNSFELPANTTQFPLEPAIGLKGLV
jgi:hypothetical protein